VYVEARVAKREFPRSMCIAQVRYSEKATRTATATEFNGIVSRHIFALDSNVRRRRSRREGAWRIRKKNCENRQTKKYIYA